MKKWMAILLCFILPVNAAAFAEGADDALPVMRFDRWMAVEDVCVCQQAIQGTGFFG